VRRQQSLQKQLPSVSELLVDVHLLGEYKAARTCEDLKRGAPPGYFLFHSENSYVSKEYSFTKYNTLVHM